MILAMHSTNATQHLGFVRVGNGPLLAPTPGLSWEAGGVFAPAVIKDDEKYRMIYRAYGDDRKSRFGYAESVDGIHWTRDPLPRLVPQRGNSDEHDGIEDPRMVAIDGHFYITYTALRGMHRFRTHIRILRTDDFVEYERIVPKFKWRWRLNDKDGVLFPEKIDGRYWLLHRIVPSIELSVSSDMRQWEYVETLIRPTEHDWETRKVGAGAPPLRTPFGWLLFYHGVDEHGIYAMSAALLSTDNPPRVLCRLPYPLIRPERIYEKDGVVPNVIFGTSVVEMEDRYRLYYGAADRVIAAADIDKAELLEALSSRMSAGTN